MLDKRYIKLDLFLLKSLKALFWVPLAIAYVLLPILNFATYHKFGVNESLYNNIITFSQILLPFFSAWWSIMSCFVFVENDSREVLAVETKRFYKLFLINFLLYVLSLLPIYCVYTSMFIGMKLEFIRIIVECALINSLVYFFMAVMRSVVAAIIMPIIYMVFSFFVSYTDGSITSKIAYISLYEATWETLGEKYLILFVFSVILFAVSACFSLKSSTFE